MPIQNLTVLGTGVLGSQIAFQSAFSGVEVVAYDVDATALAAGQARFEKLASVYARDLPDATPAQAEAALGRLRGSTDLEEAVAHAELVIEAAPERLEVKRELYGRLGQVAPAETIFATNSSTLLPSAIADATGRPERFLALHFANQIWMHNTAEVMGHPGTDPAVYETVVAFASQIGMVPIELHKEQPGYVLNTLLVPLINFALGLAVDGVADPETIDRTWTIGTGAPAGPFAILDVIGLTTPYNILSAFPDDRSQAIAAFLKGYIDEGKLGRSTGEGFYRYGA